MANVFPRRGNLYSNVLYGPSTISGQILRGLVKGATKAGKESFKKYKKDRLQQLKNELSSHNHHRHNVFSQYTPSASHARRALLSIGGYPRKGALGPKRGQLLKGKRKQLKSTIYGSASTASVEKRLKKALKVRAQNKHRTLKQYSKKK